MLFKPVYLKPKMREAPIIMGSPPHPPPPPEPVPEPERIPTPEPEPEPEPELLVPVPNEEEKPEQLPVLAFTQGIHVVYPLEARRDVLAGKVAYIYIDENGSSIFRPKHIFTALKLNDEQKSKFGNYSCIGGHQWKLERDPTRRGVGTSNVVIVGNGGVGKSSMIQRYCKGIFTKDYKKTIGVDFLERQIEVEGEEVRLMLWDTAGQEEFDAITKAYYRGAQACVLAFSTTDRDSFEAAHSWKLKVENECGEIPTVIVQNKIDLIDQTVVNPEEAELLARALGCRLLRTSVKEDINVASVFRHLAARCLAELRDTRDDYYSTPNGHQPVTINFVELIDIGSENSYFGYSVLMQKGPVSSVIIGAPNSSSSIPSHSTLSVPGAVYKCEIGTSGSCREYVIENQGNTEDAFSNLFSYKDRKDGGLLGATLEGGENVGDPFYTCSPRWKNDRRDRSGQHYLVHGICYAIHNSTNLDSDADRMMPLLNAGKQGYTLNRAVKYYYAMGQTGLSMHYIKDINELLLGAPGLLGWRGSVLQVKINNSNVLPPLQRLSEDRYKRETKVDIRIPNPVYNSVLKDDSYYFGYSISSGRFVTKYADLWYIAGAPRGDDLYGIVLLFEFPMIDDTELIVHKQIIGEQLGSYFGGSVLGVPTSGTRNRIAVADLLVGAPSYVIDTWDEGCVYFYKNDGKGNFESPTKLFGNKQIGARFGTAMSSIGDLNKDSYEDVAISAPYEDETGVVYIYLGSKNGLNPQYSQRISARSIKDSIRGFGFSMSKGLDIDENLFNDIAVGAYKSGTVAVIKSRPIIKYFANFTSAVRELSVNSKEINVQFCINYTNAANNLEMVGTDIVIRKDSRALDKEDVKKTIVIYRNERYCENLKVTLQDGNFDYTNAFTMELSYEISSNSRNKFCALCPVIDPVDTKSTILNVPFANGCGDDNICQPDLKISANIENETNSLIIGLLTTLRLKVLIENKGEPAYLCQVFIMLPDDVEIQRISSRCDFNDDGSYQCIISDVLQPNTNKEVVFDFDIKKINPLDQKLFFNLSVASRGEEVNEEDNVASITVPLRIENGIEISGISFPDSIVFVNESNQISAETAMFSNEYVIKNLGPSPMSVVSMNFYFPVQVKDPVMGPMKAFDVYEPEVFVSNQAIRCTTNYYLGFHVDTLDGSESDLKDEQRVRRSTNFEDDDTISIDSLDAFDLPVNRTISINCKSNNTRCMKVECYSTEMIYKNQFITAKFLIKAHIDVLTQITLDKDLILLRSTVEATSNFKTTLYHVPTVFIGSISKPSVSYWIYIASVFASLIILCLLILILYKLNFFKRPVRELLYDESNVNLLAAEIVSLKYTVNEKFQRLETLLLSIASGEQPTQQTSTINIEDLMNMEVENDVLILENQIDKIDFRKQLVTGGKNSKSRSSSNSVRSRSPSSSSTERGYSSYNTVCPRETPNWQKPITSFFQTTEKEPTKRLDNASHVVAMEEEVPLNNCIEVEVETNTTNGVDTEMHEECVNIGKIRYSDDNHDIAPKKKRKLDDNCYIGLQDLEN
ncbi:hypothetical protein FQR65_LT03145 [Abscondita terminalis]|nr:hypothetical protein FQR65_LT03145 [Abscondita terminalis]